MKYAVLAASVLILLCLGGLYAWSSFASELRSDYGLSMAQTQIIFGGLIATLTVVMVLAGRLLNRWSPRVISGIGGILFGAGYMIAATSNGSFWTMFVGISVVVGAGTGCGYVCALTACIRWFPQHKGLVSGVAVAGFGAGSIVLAHLAEWLFHTGTPPLTVFWWMGLCYGMIILAAAMLLSLPTPQAVQRQRANPMLATLLGDRVFWALWLGIFCGTFAGLLVIGNLKQLAAWAGASTQLAALLISAFAVGNAAGRVVWGWLADRLEERVVPVALLFLACAVGLLPWTGGSSLLLATAAVLVGLGFGACFVVYAALVGIRYGTERVASVYPLVFLGYGLSAVTGPFVGGWLFDLAGSYVPGIAIAVAVVFAGLFAFIRLSQEQQTRPADGPRLTRHAAAVVQQSR